MAVGEGVRIILDGGAMVSVAVFFGKVVWDKMRNNQGELKNMKTSSYKELVESVKMIQASTNSININVAKIDTEMKAVHEKCAQHLATQGAVNLHVQKQIDELGNKVFELVKDGG